MLLKAELRNRSFCAIINYGSESVLNNLNGIEHALKLFTQKYGKRVDTFQNGSNIILSNSWSSIDVQFEIAKKYTDIMVFGGDGTQTYVLNRIIKEHLSVNFIGVAVGTMNVHSFSNKLTDVDHIFDCPNRINLDAICCKVNGRTEYCFIDTVISTTSIARINGQITQVSAQGLLRGEKRIETPETIGSADTRIIIHQTNGKVSFPKLNNIKTIAFAFLHDGLKAQVLAGGADPAALLGFHWGLIISEQQLIWGEVPLGELQQYSPITSHFFPLADKDVVKISSLLANAHLIIDGNAIANLDQLEVQFLHAVCKITKCGVKYEICK